jgi:hypothetical protein
MAVAIAASCALRAAADAGNVQVVRELVISDTAPQFSPFVNSPESGITYLFFDTLRNAGTSSWESLRIAIERVDPASGDWREVSPSDGVSFMRTETEAVWRPTIELRVNGVYQGLPGGEWEVGRSDGATEMEIRFLGEPVKAGDAVQIRARLFNYDNLSWRLRYEARAASPADRARKR